MSVTIGDIEAAAERIKGSVQRTPCPASEPLSLATGCQIYCKLEHLQRTGSFKERGARNALVRLPDDQKKKGVITASAGNHALGLSYHGSLLKIPVTVVMPKVAPLTKITNCRNLGANVLLEGGNIEEAKQFALKLGEEKGWYYINGYDHPDIIAGQGTMGLEILEQVPDVEAIIVPIGGAGLIAGIALAVKTRKPNVQIIGVEPTRAASYAAAVQNGKPVLIQMQPTLADGLAVPKVGDNAFEIARKYVDKVLAVGERDIALAVLRLVELEKAVVEGAGATPLAVCLRHMVPELKGKKVVLPLCGGNIDTNILGRVIDRGLAADGRLCRFSTVISDRPGGLSHFTALLAEEGASVHDIEHDRAFASEDINTVTVHCVIETRDVEHIRRVRDRLQREGFQISFPQWVL
ncbi:MAG: putative threonine dehydratase catabolic [Verrucomicrobiales bacterium]|nr:putative threonine dehydratase catabolic [Verrucomicrobiales bacterium]